MEVLAVASLLFAVTPAWADWQPHTVKRGDGQGGHTSLPAKRQGLTIPGALHVMPFGLVQMDNGEIALIASRETPGVFQPVIAFSNDGGNTWSAFREMAGKCRPTNVTYLGGGTLTYCGATRHFSDDYGRTWHESVPIPKTEAGKTWHLEGNACVDRGGDGKAVRVMESGWHLKEGQSYKTGMVAVLRHSLDGGRTWQGEVSPPQWQPVLTVGDDRISGAGECALVRAANGWLVAALRTGMPPKYFDEKNNDHLTGTGISISKDDGKTWSKLNVLYKVGRHHGNLQCLPCGTLVLTLINRCDIRTGDYLDTHLRGVDALVSYDNGLTWNLKNRYTLDEFVYFDKANWLDGQCGHVGAVVLDDGSMIAVYGKYDTAEAVLIKWRPPTKPGTAATRDEPAE